MERGFRIFWLLGPFFLLIERSPADIWLSVLVMAFLARAALKRDTDWLQPHWFRAFLAFWMVCAVSAATSSQPAVSLGETLIWGRFPIFAAATVFWLGADRRLLLMMMLISVVGMIIMSGILVTEFILSSGEKTRLSWPYGDLNPGNYLAKVSLVALLGVFITAFRGPPRLSASLALIVLLTVTALFLTGERVNFIIVIASLVLLSVIGRKDNLRYSLGAVVIVVVAALLGVKMAPDRFERYKLIATSFGVHLASVVLPTH